MPTEKQWAKIKERVSEITETATSYPIFVDRYVRPYQPYWQNPIWSGTTWGGSSGSIGDAGNYSIDAIGQNMNTAFNTLGKIEFESIKSA